MQLNEVLNLLAMQLLLAPDDLIRFANEDTLGGYSPDPTQRKWPMGSLFGVEGQILYALVRALKPGHVVEIGSLRGCSTAHLATALSVNGSGRMTAIDVEEKARDLFPAHLESIVSPVIGDGLAWLRDQPDASIDFVFEDSSHATEMCAAVAELCKTKLAPGGVLVMHDAAHDFANLEGGQRITSPVGGEIRAGLDRAIKNEYRVYLAEPSDCGVAVWRRKAEKVIQSFFPLGVSLMPDGSIEMDGYIPVENAKPLPGDPAEYVTDGKAYQDTDPVLQAQEDEPVSEAVGHMTQFEEYTWGSPLEGMSKAELRKVAASFGITVKSKMTNEQIIAAIKEIKAE